jgi:ABC-2 type transport system permease protein
MSSLLIIIRREFASYFATPLAAVFLVVFVAVSSGMTFFVSGFFDRAQADLSSFFTWQPWLYLVLMPAVGMRLWAEERRLGTVELLMTLPVQPWKFVLGKWAAAFVFAGLALVLTMPMWITVNILGSPDNGVILASYIGAWLMAGAFLAISACISALTKNQVLAFIGAVITGFVFVMAGFDLILSAVRPWAPDVIVQAIASMSFIGHFQRITDGVFEGSALVFFFSLITFALWLNVQILDARKAS